MKIPTSHLASDHETNAIVANNTLFSHECLSTFRNTKDEKYDYENVIIENK